ncbi:MAG: tetratricopeptide repeat protein [Alphaproteobacteria bacterium]
MTDIFQEVEEDLRRDQFAKLWRRYGTYVLVAAAAIVIATAGFVAWKQHRLNQRLAEGNQFAVAVQLANDGKMREASEAFAAMAERSADGYAMLARLREAALLARQGDLAAAVRAYDALAKDASDPAVRDLATLQSAALSLDSADAGELKAKIDPLTVPGNAWRYSALELSALLAQRTGDRTRAHEILAQIKEDAGAPSGIRTRAAELLDALGK